MSKRKINSSLNSSIRQNTATAGEGFNQLVNLQKLTNEHLLTIGNTLSSSLLAERVNALVDIVTLKEIDKQEDETKEIGDTLKESLEIQKGLLLAQSAAAAQIASTIKTFKTIGDRLGELKADLHTNYGSISKALLSSRIVKSGSMMDRILGVSKRVARNDFVDRQRLLGSTKSKKELQTNYKEAARTSKEISKNDNEIEIFKRKTGLNEDQMANTKAGKDLLDRKENLGHEYAKHDLSAQIAKDSIKAGRNQTVSEEDQQETLKVQEKQTDVLKEIADNTKKDPNNIKASVKPGDSGGGLFGGIAAGAAGAIGLLGSALAALGKGLGAGLEGLLSGVAKGLARFFNPATLVGLGAFTLAALGLGKALEYAAPGIEAFAPILIKVADVLQNVIVKGIETVPAIIKSVGDVITGVIKTISDSIINLMNQITESIERLSKVDGGALANVGAGLLAVSVGMAAFAGANVISGITNLGVGLLNKISGQKSPVEQLEEISKMGPGLMNAGIGVEKLSAGLKGFSATDGTTINKMTNDVNNIKQKANGVNSTNVVAPTINNNNKQTQIAKIEAPIRNSDSSVDRYFSTRAVY